MVKNEGQFGYYEYKSTTGITAATDLEIKLGKGCFIANLSLSTSDRYASSYFIYFSYKDTKGDFQDVSIKSGFVTYRNDVAIQDVVFEGPGKITANLTPQDVAAGGVMLFTAYIRRLKP